MRIPEAGLIPKWYGVAYRDYTTCHSICYPVPLNWAVKWLRELWLFIKFPTNMSGTEKELMRLLISARSDAYKRGHEEGKRNISLQDALSKLESIGLVPQKRSTL